MKSKFLAAIFLTSIALVSCKEEKKEPMNEIVSQENTTEQPKLDSKENLTENVVQNPVSPVYKPEDLAKDVKDKPVTNLVLSESNFDFGKITKGQVVEHTYEVTNTGKNPLIIAHVRPGCGCTAPDFTKEPILPGKKGKITLKFNSENFDGMVQKQAEVYANVNAVPIMLTFTADIQAK
jgi:hypothetical protein